MTRRLIDTVVRTPPLPAERAARADALVNREWLVTNGIGGYSSNSVAGSNTRRYHGILVAALPNPLGRIVMLNRLHESVAGASGAPTLIDRANAPDVIREFRLEIGLPVWELAVDGVVIEKRIWMPHGQNTTFIQYRLIEGKSATIDLRPGLHFRGYEDAVDSKVASRYDAKAEKGFLYVEGVGDLPRVHMHVENDAGTFVSDEKAFSELDYPVEDARGFPARGAAWSPGYFRAELRGEAPVVLVASTETEDEIAALPSADARSC